MKIIILLTLIFLTSCSSLTLNNIAPGYIEAFTAIKSLIIVDKENKDITKDLIDKIPYASSLISIGKGKNALMILESSLNGEHTWVTQDGVYIVTRDGKIIKTAGLKNNLIDFVTPSINYKTLKKNESFSYFTYLSYDKPSLSNLKLRSTITLRDKETVSLFMQEKELFLIEERIENVYLGWSELNKYWVDKDFYVWKSIQHTSPKLPPFYIEITKKPAE